MKNRGIGHIEIIISFILFIGFLFLGLYFFNPLNTNRLLDSSLYYTYDSIIKNATSTMLIYGISIKNSVLADNVELILSRGAASGNGLRIETNLGRKLDSKYESERIYISRQGERFIFVIFGEFINDDSQITGSSFINYPENYSISSSDEKSIVSENRLLLLNESYWRNYDSLKESFNLPRRIDFSFSVLFSENDKIIASKQIPDGINVFSDTKRIEVLRNNGIRQYADIIVSVW